MDKRLGKYIPLVDFLALVLGEDSEIVLQDFTQGLEKSLVHIRNNLSGREIGSPATDFVLEVFKKKLYLEKDFLVNYRTKSTAGREFYSSSFFIKEDNKLLGMICINSDKSKLLSIKELLESGVSFINQELKLNQEEDQERSDDDIVENFYSTAENLIEDTIAREANGKDLKRYNLTKNEKIAIVRSLYQKGFFEFKDSVSKVAEAFRMSEVSIYKYIQEVKQDEG